MGIPFAQVAVIIYIGNIDNTCIEDPHVTDISVTHVYCDRPSVLETPCCMMMHSTKVTEAA